MNTSTRLFSALAVGAFLSLGLIAVPATAQDKAKATKAAPAKAEKGAAKITPLLENDKVKVYESLYRPGDENKAVATTAYRILRVLKGGTITRTYADGKIEKVAFKTGEVKFLEPFKTAYVSKNEGKSDIQFYVVQLK
jgi:hypothetical protein